MASTSRRSGTGRSSPPSWPRPRRPPLTGTGAPGKRPEIEPSYLTELATACPDPAHGAVYGKLVVEASVRRTLAADAEDLDSQTSAIGYSARRLFTAHVDGGRHVEVSADYANEVAGLLRRHATAFSPDTTVAGPGRPALRSDRPCGSQSR